MLLFFFERFQEFDSIVKFRNHKKFPKELILIYMLDAYPISEDDPLAELFCINQEYCDIFVKGSFQADEIGKHYILDTSAITEMLNPEFLDNSLLDYYMKKRIISSRKVGSIFYNLTPAARHRFADIFCG
jgi:hypothetical protein